MDDFLSFRRMITPVLIQILFVLGSLAAIIGGLVTLGRSAGLGLVLIVFVPLLLRVICENAIVFFRMNETLTDIRQLLREQRVTPNGRAAPQPTATYVAAPPAPVRTPRADTAPLPSAVASPASIPAAPLTPSTGSSLTSTGPSPAAATMSQQPEVQGPFGALVTDPPEAAGMAHRAYQENKSESVSIVIDAVVRALDGADVRCRPVQGSDAFIQEVRDAGSWDARRQVFVRHLIRLQRAYEQSK